MALEALARGSQPQKELAALNRAALALKAGLTERCGRAPSGAAGQPQDACPEAPRYGLRLRTGRSLAKHTNRRSQNLMRR